LPPGNNAVQNKSITPLVQFVCALLILITTFELSLEKFAIAQVTIISRTDNQAQEPEPEAEPEFD
jgi:hypothetical protein